MSYWGGSGDEVVLLGFDGWKVLRFYPRILEYLANCVTFFHLRLEGRVGIVDEFILDFLSVHFGERYIASLSFSDEFDQGGVEAVVGVVRNQQDSCDYYDNGDEESNRRRGSHKKPRPGLPARHSTGIIHRMNLEAVLDFLNDEMTLPNGRKLRDTLPADLWLLDDVIVPILATTAEGLPRTPCATIVSPCDTTSGPKAAR